jgi:hypothetical protein
MLMTGMALADDISNNLDATVDTVAEVMPLNPSGPAGLTQLYVVPQNGDGKNGCNLTGSTSLSVSVSSSNTSVATVSPSSATFTSCGATSTLTVTPVASGTATISVSQSSNNTGGTFNFAPASFTVNVSPPPNTAPGVAITGVTGGSSYDKGSVPTATCQVTDAEDGNSSFAATLSAITGPNASDGIGEQTASCSYTDGGGLTASASATYGIIDPSGPTIDYLLSPSSPDGDNDWYVSDVSLSWSVADNESPNSLTKVGCDDQSITSDQDATQYDCSATSAGGSAGPVSVGVKRDATAPTINGSASPAANADGWNKTDVTVSFSCDDNLSGIAECGPSATLTEEGADQSVSGTAMDNAGNSSASASVSGINIDKTAPTADATRSPIANGFGWSNSNVTVHFTGTDDLSGIAGCSADVVLTAETAGQSASGTCTDKAGNESAPAGVVGINIDKTAPTASASASPAPNSNGWNNTNVTVSFSGLDGLSGNNSCDAAVVLSAEGAGQSASGTCTDKADNVSEPASVTGINIDKTDPSISLIGGPANGSSYYFGSVPAAPTCSASDGLSGIDGSCSVSSYSTAVGTHTVKASATDKAGNDAEASATYTVLAWTTNGFFAPVDMGGVTNTIKGGQTVPLKFELYAGSTELKSTAYVSSFKSQLIDCGTLTGNAEDVIEITSTGGTSLRFDATGDQFIQNWATPKTSGKCYSATVSFQDGSSIIAFFKTK